MTIYIRIELFCIINNKFHLKSKYLKNVTGEFYYYHYFIFAYLVSFRG